MIDVIILGDGFTAASQFAERARRMAARTPRAQGVRHLRRLSTDPCAVHAVRPARVEHSGFVLPVPHEQRRRVARHGPFKRRR